MGFFDTKKRLMGSLGTSSIEAQTNSSKYVYDLYFKDSQAYKEGIIIRSDLSEEPIDTRIINIDKTVIEKRIEVRPDYVLNDGDYIYYPQDNKYYIVTEFESNVTVPYGKATLCNRMLKNKYFERDIPCYMENSSYGSKGLVYNQPFYSDFDSRGVILVQKNKITDRIYDGMRFVFNHSKEDIYQITKKNGVFVNGMYQMVCKYTKFVQEDDLENNLAFNSSLEDNTGGDETKVKYLYITGKEYVNLGGVETYKLNGLDDVSNVVFSLDEYSVSESIAEIISATDNECTIKMNKEEITQIEARDLEGKLLAIFTIYIIPEGEEVSTWGL